jgi:transposase-like protein
MMPGNTTVNVLKSEVAKMPLKGKPACPYCGRPLTFVYGDVDRGHLGQKCYTCGKTSLVDMACMKAYRICDDAAAG